MYNIDKRRKMLHGKVKDLITELEKENPEAEVTCCGDDYIVIHVEEDNSVVTIDCEDLGEAYDFDERTIAKEEAVKYYNVPDVKKVVNYVSKERLLEMLKILVKDKVSIDENVQESLKNLGFTSEEIEMLVSLET